MDVAILAGGLGTRLRGVWSGPKCLAPFAGKPLLAHLLEHVQRLQPRNVSIILSYKGWEVLDWLANFGPQGVRATIVMNEKPLGTCGAFREAIPGLQAPVLVLNGDTLPGYSFEALVALYKGPRRPNCVAAWCGDNYAGAMIMGSEVLEHVARSRHFNFDPLLFADAERFLVPSFFDIGTPENFKKATRRQP